MAFPASTYRVQLHKGFNLKDLKKILPYLHKLGISTIYASPIFQARSGSTHGYDVTDSLKVNKEIGSLSEWRRLKKEMNKFNMSWLQDIVPNHMALNSSNPWIYNIMERGPQSPFYHYFDIDWNHPDKEFNGKLMLPFLGADLSEVIQKSELQLVFNDGFYFQYYDQLYPLSEQTYPVVLKFIAENKSLNDIQQKKIGEYINKLKTPSENEKKWNTLKKRLVVFLQDNLLKETASSCESINEDKEVIGLLLQRQFYRLTHWRTTEQKINYRRFFSINDLICLRMEDEIVFNDYHQFIKTLCDENIVDGLRIDHIDGLFNPVEYLERLRSLVGKDKYVVVEKILEWEEKLPAQWPVQGSSGYSFLATVNQLFTNTNAEKVFTDNYKGITDSSKSYEEQVFHSKENFVKSRMGGELQNLISLLKERNLLPDNSTGMARWKEALGSFLAAWPVYRIYTASFPLDKSDKEKVLEAYDRTVEVFPGLKDELEHLLQLFQGKADFPKIDQLYFLQRCQQFTGPLAAKGVEDTIFYRYNRLISHNEVGDTPEVFGTDVKSFHKRMQHRQKLFPYAINGTSTHDTKRGEDARMRINSLADIPEKWFNQWQEWRKMNKSARVQKNVPDENEEYFIYQALMGAYTYSKDHTLLQRTKDYIQKCLREAKVHSNWAEPNEKYEKAVLSFLENIFRNEEFLDSFKPFQEDISLQGIFKSFGQIILKVCSPGIPDIYQGTEFMDLSFVDPDNRREVNYNSRRLSLDGISAYNSPSFIMELLENYETGRVKMFVLYHTLQLRLQHTELFTVGEYIPLKVSKKYKDDVLAFARTYDDDFCVVIIPLHRDESCGRREFYPQPDIWKKASVKLPDNFPQKWRNILTNDILDIDKNAILLKQAFGGFPMTVLKPAIHEI